MNCHSRRDMVNSCKLHHCPAGPFEKSKVLVIIVLYLHSIDLILMGTNTYRMFTRFWPDATGEDPEITVAMNSIPKIVFSGSIKEVQWGNHGNISLVADDAVTHIKSLKEAGGKNMIMWGSLSLAQSLLKANLFDEIQLIVAPVAIGKGYKLFPETPELFSLKLTGNKVFSEGTMLHIYEPK